MSMESHIGRHVRCPKCLSVLLEPRFVTVYQCGGCGSSLRVKNQGASVTHPDPESSEQNSSRSSLEGSTQTSKYISSDGQESVSNYSQCTEDVEGNIGVSNSDRAREAESSNHVTIVDYLPSISAHMAEMRSSLAVTSAMDAPMSSSLGAMGPLLRKLDSLLPPGYRLPKLLKDRIQLLKADLEEISVALLEQSMVDSPNEMAKYWMNEVRELCYDIEDFIDNMMSTHADAKMRSVQSYRVGRVKIAWLPKTRKPCTRAAKVAELSSLVREANERHHRYLDGCTSSSRRVFTGNGWIPALYAEAGKYLVGVDYSKMKLIKWLTDEEEQQLKVVAIVGPAGIGKTTLAKQVYHEVGEQFECRAFVRASRKPDMRRLLGSILCQVQECPEPSDSCTVQKLIDNLTKHFQDKRCLIVIDDLWETIAWDIVISAFPEGDNRSRIITTAENEGVALECCHYQSNNILKMNRLGRDDSGILFFYMVFGPEHPCPEQLKEVSNIIVTKCAGLPLAIICLAGLLASMPGNSELWQHVQDFLCSNLSTNTSLEDILQEILKLSYNTLPRHLKTCLMYLSMYPEGHTLWKADLVKQWIAEGFISAPEGKEREEVAESYFVELVNRGMIQPVDINIHDEVSSCTLHHLVLDLITFEANEENFFTALDYSQTIRGHYIKARRLSLHFSNTRNATKPSGLPLSKVRTIGFFGIFQCVPSVVQFKLLRVLILEFWGDQRGSMRFNLTEVCRLFQLRYLKILCNASVEVELPTQIRMLRYLETLIIDAAVSAVPLDIVHLPGLLHLSLGDKTDLPDEIGRIRSLRTLHYFDLGSNSKDNVLSLGDLTNLQYLHLTYYTEESDEHLKRNLAALASSLGKLVNLKSVTLAPGASATAVYHDVCSSMSSHPVFLQRLELLPPICIFSILPEWIGQLQELRFLKVVVCELFMKDMDMLIGLPVLTNLSLYVRQPTTESIIFKRGAFLGLKYFEYTCDVMSLAFQEESFPNLQRLELSFNAHRGEQYYDLLSGIDCLLNLKEIAGTIGAAAGAGEPDRRAAESAFTDAIHKHPRFPSYDKIKRVDRVGEEYQPRSQATNFPSDKHDPAKRSESHDIIQKQRKREEGDSSDDQPIILLKETKEEIKHCTDNWISHIPPTGSVILQSGSRSRQRTIASSVIEGEKYTGSVLVEGTAGDTDVDALCRLSDNLAAAFHSPDDLAFLADARIAVPGAPDLCVHRSVLSARSPFLRAVFARRAAGSSTDVEGDRIKLQELLGDEVEVGYEALRLVLDFLYSGRVIVDLPESACICSDKDGCAHVGCYPAVSFKTQVLFVASTFQVFQLTNHFQRRLLDVLDRVEVDNLPLILSVANLCNKSCTKLLERCLEMVVRSNLDMISLEKALPPDVIKQITDSRLSLGLVSPEDNGFPNKHVRRILRALDSDDVELVRMLLKEGQTNLDDAFALHYAVEHCDSKITTELLDIALADVNLRNPRGYTVLHLAAKRRDPKIVVSLLNQGARPSDLTIDGRKAVQISKRLTKHGNHFCITEEGKPSPKDWLCIEILEQAERRDPQLGEASVSLAMAGECQHGRLLYLENRVALARIMFPIEARVAMDIAQVDGTLEFTLASGANPRPEIQGGTVDLNETPFIMKDEHLARIRALSKTVELGKRFFPRCSNVLDKIMDDEAELASLRRDTSTSTSIDKKRRFNDLQDLLLKAFNEDKEEFDRSAISSSSSSTTSIGAGRLPVWPRR